MYIQLNYLIYPTKLLDLHLQVETKNCLDFISGSTKVPSGGHSHGKGAISKKRMSQVPWKPPLTEEFPSSSWLIFKPIQRKMKSLGFSIGGTCPIKPSMIEDSFQSWFTNGLPTWFQLSIHHLLLVIYPLLSPINHQKCCSCFCSWLVLVPLFSCYAFLLRLIRVHPQYL